MELERLRALKNALSNLPHEEKSHLVHAQRVAPNLVDDDHMLIFLRGEDYDVNFALKRLRRHWSQRHEIFGPDKYSLPMTLGGAMRDDIHLLKQGYLTILPTCDESGRSIIYLNNAVRTRVPTREEKLRMLWYILHVVMQKPAAQKSGYVVLSNTRAGRVGDPKWAYQAISMNRYFPIKWKSIHACHTNAVFPFASQAVKAFLSKEQRQYFLLHNGTDESVLEALSENSLPKDCVPKDLGGTLCASSVAFVQDRLTAEGVSLELDENIGISLLLCEDLTAEGDSPGQYVRETNEDDKIMQGSSIIVTHHKHPQLDSNHINDNPDVNKYVSSVQGDTSAGKNNFSRAEYTLAEPSSLGIKAISPMFFEQQEPGYTSKKWTERKRQGSDNPGNATKKTRATAKAEIKSKHGRKGDPRMNRSVQAKVDDPSLSLLDALVAGGFVFPNLNAPGISIGGAKDEDGVTVYQRRNQLMRRMRYMKHKATTS